MSNECHSDTRSDPVSIVDVPVSESLNCLDYNLKQLNQKSDILVFNTIRIIYQVVVQEENLKRRKAILQSVIERIKSVDFDPVTMLVFIQSDPDHEIVVPAVWGYLKYRQCTAEEPYLAVKELLALLTNGKVVNRGAVFAGLVYFGDRKVCAATRTIIETISPLEAREFLRASTVPLHRATIEFCLNWLLDLARRRSTEVLTRVASALSSSILASPTQSIQDHEFNFGPYGFVSEQAHPDITLTALLRELEPVLGLLAEQDVTEINEMIEIFRNPEQIELDKLKRREVSTRRAENAPRRNKDRRVIDISPHIERRQLERRTSARREGLRR